jgi:membrane protein implicated in regulation of membrane protease activity
MIQTETQPGEGSNLRWFVTGFIAMALLLLVGTGFSVLMYLRGLDTTLKPSFVCAGGTFLSFVSAWLTVKVMRGRGLNYP